MSRSEMSRSDYNPTPAERHWVRNAVDGNRGYLVSRGGRTMVRLDRPQEIVTERTAHWVDEAKDAPYPVSYLARVAYAADRELLKVLGRPGDARKVWLEQPEGFRRDWVEDGPRSEEGFGEREGDELRARVYLRIMRVLRPLGT